MNQASISSQLGGMPCRVEDTPEMLRLRADGEFQRLGDALVGQYRHREAAAAYGQALRNAPEDLRLWKRFAGASLTVGNFAVAEKAYRRSLELGAEEPDVAYCLGFSRYLQRQYAAAAEFFAAGYPCDEEQEIALIYWHTLAACRAGSRRVLLENYRTGMQISHHIAYEKVVALFCGLIPPQEIEAWIGAEEDELNVVIALYGLSVYYESVGQSDAHDRTLQILLSHDTYWPCLSYLAAWWDDASI